MATSIYSFITQPFRYAEKVDQVVRNQFTLARTIEIQGQLTNMADAEAVATTIHNLLKQPRIRFEVTVLGVNVMSLDQLDGQTPCALLTSDRFQLTEGRLVLIPDFTINLGAGQTVLRCWG